MGKQAMKNIITGVQATSIIVGRKLNELILITEIVVSEPRAKLPPGV